jgi:8-oxo-dGTP diphosphatase
MFNSFEQDVGRLKDGMIFGEKLSGVEYRERTGVYGIAEDALGRAAIVRIPTGYFLIGGGIEPGEEREAALRREFLEETGYSVTVGDYIGTAGGYYYSDYFGSYMFGTGFFYRVRMLEKVAEPVETDHALVFVEKPGCARLLKYDYQRWAVVKAFGL